MADLSSEPSAKKARVEETSAVVPTASAHAADAPPRAEGGASSAVGSQLHRSLSQAGEATHYSSPRSWETADGIGGIGAASLLAPMVDSVDRAKVNALQCVNEPLTQLGENGEFYMRGVKYTLTPTFSNEPFASGARSTIWEARRDSDAPDHNVRSSLVRGSTIDRICPAYNEAVVCVKILRCGDSSLLCESEAAMSAGLGNPIFSAAGSEAARCQAQMHARAQLYTAVTGSAGVVGLLAVSNILEVHSKWLKLPGSVSCVDGFPDGKNGRNKWCIFVLQFAAKGSLANEEMMSSLFYENIPAAAVGVVGDTGAAGGAAGAGPAVVELPERLQRLRSASDSRRLLIEPRDERCVPHISLCF